MERKGGGGSRRWARVGGGGIGGEKIMLERGSEKDWGGIYQIGRG